MPAAHENGTATRICKDTTEHDADSRSNLHNTLQCCNGSIEAKHQERSNRSTNMQNYVVIGRGGQHVLVVVDAVGSSGTGSGSSIISSSSGRSSSSSSSSSSSISK